jgi:hypothetical protein
MSFERRFRRFWGQNTVAARVSQKPSFLRECDSLGADKQSSKTLAARLNRF